MEYTIKFLPSASDEQRCHLYVGQNRLSLVADYGTPWLAGDTGKVRFSRPSGDTLASLEFPGHKTNSKGGQSRTSFALIYDHAVYAIFNQHTWPDEDDPDAVPYFVIETEGQRWLALGEETNGRVAPDRYVFCDNAPANLQSYAQPMDDCLADPVGEIHREQVTADYQVTLPDGRFRQPQLILLALVFLIHQLPD
ncbi:MAG: hypothetical protein H6659_08105 [Ardenticatenaceae bacterium]|nr:hypothetical protein [Ardenticatenaceae bacterium]